MIRIIDILIASFLLIILFPIFVGVFILGYIDTGAPIFVQIRVGRNLVPFKLIKFRSMKKGTLSVATHKADPNSITKLGKFLRKSKLDELPQLINVIKGEMSLVGPRPNLFNQIELIEERKKLGIYSVSPGITGLAQINEVDMSNPRILAQIDFEMINSLNLYNYFKYLILTLRGKGQGDRVHKT